MHCFDLYRDGKLLAPRGASTADDGEFSAYPYAAETAYQLNMMGIPVREALAFVAVELASTPPNMRTTAAKDLRSLCYKSPHSVMQQINIITDLDSPDPIDAMAYRDNADFFEPRKGQTHILWRRHKWVGGGFIVDRRTNPFDSSTMPESMSRIYEDSLERRLKFH